MPEPAFAPATLCARSIRVRGVVQGVGFRPFVYRLAQSCGLAGWVRNGAEGVEIHLEGEQSAIDRFVRELEAGHPRAAAIAGIEAAPAEALGLRGFAIRASRAGESPTTRVSPDLAVCDACLRELSDPGDRRYRYPYINCTDCGPRYSIVEALPYDRANTTMRAWTMDPFCAAQYHDPGDRRFHAQPVACPACGPRYELRWPGSPPQASGDEAIAGAAGLLRESAIVAIKGLGGYHLACDARQPAAVRALRERKYRKEKPFALMAATLDAARQLVALSPECEDLLTSPARPIVLAPARVPLEGVAPGNHELGVMLPYTPLHHLLFDSGAPEVLVMTSANRSNEPIAYEEDDARERLAGIADAFLVGQRPIARRIDDSVVREGALGPAILRRARGYAPGAVATLPCRRPILALGADLKNTVTLTIEGQALVSQHIGDLSDYRALEAFRRTIADLTAMYQVPWDDLLAVHDMHPEYASTRHALELPAWGKGAVQHHRAHVASVLAERGAFEEPVLGVAWDGAGYGDDGSIWGGEIFFGSVATGFERVAHLRPAALPGGDAAARHPVQAAAGFLAQLDRPQHWTAPPFGFPARFTQALRLARSGVRSFTTTSMGRLFDAVAALVGFTREITFEGQAAMWLEYQARQAGPVEAYPFPFAGGEFDFRPLLEAVLEDRTKHRPAPEIARAFHAALGAGLEQAALTLCADRPARAIVLSGGVFQNGLLLEELRARFAGSPWPLWTNRAVPANDGGVSLGQAALAAFGRFDSPHA